MVGIHILGVLLMLQEEPMVAGHAQVVVHPNQRALLLTKAHPIVLLSHGEVLPTLVILLGKRHAKVA